MSSIHKLYSQSWMGFAIKISWLSKIYSAPVTRNMFTLECRFRWGIAYAILYRNTLPGWVTGMSYGFQSLNLKSMSFPIMIKWFFQDPILQCVTHLYIIFELTKSHHNKMSPGLSFSWAQYLHFLTWNCGRTICYNTIFDVRKLVLCLKMQVNASETCALW